MQSHELSNQSAAGGGARWARGGTHTTVSKSATHEDGLSRSTAHQLRRAVVYKTVFIPLLLCMLWYNSSSVIDLVFICHVGLA